MSRISILFVLAWAGCPTPDSPEPPEAPVDTDVVDTANEDTASPDTASPDTGTPPPATALVRAHVPLAPEDVTTRLLTATPDGAFVQAYETTTGTVVEVEVPSGGFLTLARFTPANVDLETLSAVQDNDEVWFEGRVPNDVVGTFTIDVDTAPDVEHDSIDVRLLCHSFGNISIPAKLTAQTRSRCTDPTQPVSAIAAAYLGGDRVPAAIGYVVGLTWTGMAPDATLQGTLDGWTSDYGRATVRYSHEGPDRQLYVSGFASRGGSDHGLNPVSAEALVQEGGVVATREFPAHEGFHQQVYATVGEIIDAGYEQRVTILASPAAEGVASVLELDTEDLPPPLTATMSYATETEVADLTLPEGWACAGRGGNLVRLSGVARTDLDRWSHELVGPYSSTVTWPQLDPELESRRASVGPRRLSRGTVYSVDGGYDAFRTSPDVWSRAETWLVGRPEGSRVCMMRIGIE